MQVGTYTYLRIFGRTHSVCVLKMGQWIPQNYFHCSTTPCHILEGSKHWAQSSLLWSEKNWQRSNHVAPQS